MLLGLNLLKQTKDDFLTDLAILAKAQSTLILIDTNILSYLFKLHAAARQEFFDWTAKAIGEGRLFLPAWCAGEYLARVRENQLHIYTPRSKDDQPRNQLEAMLDTASLFVDEAVLAASGFTGTRAQYLTGFREAIDGLKQYTRAFRHQFDPDKIHAEIEEFLGPVVLDSPVAQLCDRAAKEGPARIEHRLPPGFRDEGKPENRLGDLIIWLEILRYSEIRKDDFTHVLFLTNDEKSDWVYAPAKRLDTVRGMLRPVPNNNPVLKIIDPRLVSEFKQVVGHEHVAISTLSTLVQGLSKTDPTVVAQLAAAIQIELVASDGVVPESSAAEAEAAAVEPEAAEVVAVPEVVQEEPAEADPVAPVLPVEPVPPAGVNPGDAIALAIQVQGYRDADYQSDGPDALNDIISSLKSHNWYIQNPAILKLSTILKEEFSPTSWFVLGRNIYQAACGNAQKAMDFMLNLDSRLRAFPEPASKYVLAGIVYEIYFNGQGDLRQTPKAGEFAKPLALVAKEGYEDVRDFIRAKLEAAGANLFFSPGDERHCLVVVRSEPAAGPDPDDEEKRILTSITLDGREILVAAVPGADDWFVRYRLSYRAKDLVDDIAISLSIPHWALGLELYPQVKADARFYIPEGRWLNPGVVLQAPIAD
ncbi:UNVERIFIED_ORG: putative nucleic acid-binding protein [Pseudomonas putida]|nr:putative nucleic acid-binding protein [Pseudomonas putida]